MLSFCSVKLILNFVIIFVALHQLFSLHWFIHLSMDLESFFFLPFLPSWFPSFIHTLSYVYCFFSFYTEGSRSRTGKAMVPKSGLLSLVVNSVTEGKWFICSWGLHSSLWMVTAFKVHVMLAKEIYLTFMATYSLSLSGQAGLNISSISDLTLTWYGFNTSLLTSKRNLNTFSYPDWCINWNKFVIILEASVVIALQVWWLSVNL